MELDEDDDAEDSICLAAYMCMPLATVPAGKLRIRKQI